MHAMKDSYLMDQRLECVEVVEHGLVWIQLVKVRKSHTYYIPELVVQG